MALSLFPIRVPASSEPINRCRCENGTGSLRLEDGAFKSKSAPLIRIHFLPTWNDFPENGDEWNAAFHAKLRARSHDTAKSFQKSSHSLYNSRDPFMTPSPSLGKAVEDYRTPRRFASHGAVGKSARFWTAPVLWRFPLRKEKSKRAPASTAGARSKRTNRTTETTRLLLNHDTPAADHRARCGAVQSAHLIVIHDRARGRVPDLDPELVRDTAAADLAIDGCEHEAVAYHAVDRARALVLRPRAAHHQPIVTRAVELQVPRLEQEFRLARRHGLALFVSRHEPEIRLAGQSRIPHRRAGRRIDPPAARHKPRARIVDHHDGLQGIHRVRGTAVPTGVRDTELHLIHTRAGEGDRGRHRLGRLIHHSGHRVAINNPLRGERPVAAAETAGECHRGVCGKHRSAGRTRDRHQRGVAGVHL